MRNNKKTNKRQEDIKAFTVVQSSKALSKHTKTIYFRKKKEKMTIGSFINYSNLS